MTGKGAAGDSRENPKKGRVDSLGCSYQAWRGFWSDALGSLVAVRPENEALPDPKSSAALQGLGGDSIRKVLFLQHSHLLHRNVTCTHGCA